MAFPTLTQIGITITDKGSRMFTNGVGPPAGGDPAMVIAARAVLLDLAILEFLKRAFMGTNDLKIAPDGTLVTPNVHDGDLSGVIVTPGKEVPLLVRLLSGEKICFCLEDIDRLTVNNFKQGNIILDMTVEAEEILSNEVVNEYTNRRDEVTIAGLTARFKEQRFIVVRVNPSYGSELMCVCRRICLLEDWRERI